ncbi:MAG: hypothetical protein RR346_05540 [Bacteroidales bacterium]
MQLHLFNPENDLALANGDPNFVAPVSARKLARDLASLPAWWSEPDDLIFEEKKDYSDVPLTVCAPWGWSAEVKKRFLKAGVSTALLPTDDQIERIRELSHRRTGISILNALADDSAYSWQLPSLPEELFSLSDVERFVEQNPLSVLKIPWSSSGKGLHWVDQYPAFNRENWLRPVFEKTGSVMGEVVCDKVLDFAMVFYAEKNGVVCFRGYSLFETDKRGSYSGNKLLPDDAIVDVLCEYVESAQLLQLQLSLCRILSEQIKGDYVGYLGVDMLVYADRDAPGFLLHPCIELNLRMTMGIAARLFYDKHTCGGEGIFSIIHLARKKGLYDRFLQGDISHPEWSGDRLRTGCLLLTPVNKHTQYVAVAEMRSAL